LSVYAWINTKDYEDDEEHKVHKYYMIAIITLGILSLFYLFCICFKRKDLSIAIDCIDASADFMNGTKRILFVSLFHFILALVIILVWIFAMLCVTSLLEI